MDCNFLWLMDLNDIAKIAGELMAFEDEMALAFKNGEVRGPAHFVRGNEVQLIKIFHGLKKETDCVVNSDAIKLPLEYLIEKKLIEIPDNIEHENPIFGGIKDNAWLFLSYRNHYHLLLRGVPKEHLKEEILNGRSMHPLNKEYNVVTSAIVPGQISIAVGYALGLKKGEMKSHVWAFCGDMAAETGIYEECTKYAEGHDLPITFVTEDNGISCETPTQNVWAEDRRVYRALRKNEIRYYYTNNFPHQGVGREAGF